MCEARGDIVRRDLCWAQNLPKAYLSGSAYSIALAGPRGAWNYSIQFKSIQSTPGPPYFLE